MSENQFERSTENRRAVRGAEALIDRALEAAPALLGQADQTLDALTAARQRAAARRATRDQLRADLRNRRERGLG